MATVQLDKSTYLDFTGYRFTDEPTVATAYNLPSGTVTTATNAGINVAIVLDRKQDPTGLLAEDWGARQKALANLDSSGTLWTTYGADKAQFDHVRHELETTYGFTVLDGTDSAANGDYVTSAESRTIWIEVDTAQQFNALFGTTLQQYTPDSSGTGPQYDFVFWNGNLSLPEEWNVKGLWIDTNNSPASSNMAPGDSVTLPEGPQSLGNDSSKQQDRTSHAISTLYDFPLSGLNVKTQPVGLVEIGIGTALPGDKTPPEQTKEFQERLTQFLANNGQSGTRTSNPGQMARSRRSNGRSMSVSSHRQTPTATSRSTTGPAMPGMPAPRRSRRCRARSGNVCIPPARSRAPSGTARS